MGTLDNIMAFASDPNNLIVFTGIGFGFVVLAIVGAYVISKLIDSRYPPVTFLVINRETCAEVTQRLVGDMVVNVGILDLFMGKQDVGEDIKAFKKYEKIGRMGAKPVYLACMVKDSLVPIDTYWEKKDKDGNMIPYILPESIVEGKRVARRYISAIEMARQMAKVQEPLIASIMTMLPLALILLIYLIGTAWAFSFVLSVITEASENLAEAARIMANMTADTAKEAVIVEVGG